MIISELRIQLDLYLENRIDILENIAFRYSNRYIFVDSLDGYCYLFDRNGNEDDVKKIKSIRDEAFAWCRSLESIVIPDSVESIGYGAFSDCKNLKSIVIPDSVKNIGDYAFAWCKSLKSIIIPDSVKNIGDYAFGGCESLESIVIPDSIENIGFGLFVCCENLKSLAFKGKTIDQVKGMKNYPFGIEDESIIRCC